MRRCRIAIEDWEGNRIVLGIHDIAETYFPDWALHSKIHFTYNVDNRFKIEFREVDANAE